MKAKAADKGPVRILMCSLYGQVKKYDENKGVQHDDLVDHPLDDPIAEKERLKKISENADAKILEEMFGGKADDCNGVFWQ